MIPNTQTILHCVFGDPVSQSMSPIMHNTAFAERKLNCCYLAFEVKEIGPAMSAVRTLPIRGASVTIPHKVRVMDFLDEIDPLAKKMGAVNTVTNINGKLSGKNTDGLGAVMALKEKTALSGKDLLLLGSGGAARAIGFAAREEGAKITVSNREEDRREAEALAEELDCPFVLLDSVGQTSPQVLVNATPVGMGALKDQMPVPDEFLVSSMIVMDIVYNPLETRLLAHAREKGCETVDGAAMFVYQGAAQFETWTGQKAPVEAMRRVVLEQLSRK